MMLRRRCAAALGMTMVALAFGQKPERLTFEVVSIKLAKPGVDRGGIKALPGGQTYESKNIPVKLIMSLMYKMPMRQISGGPDWFESERYDIEAKAAHAYSLDDLHIMFQNLLADEFKLKFHKETREGPVYALTVDKSGLKMKVNSTEQDFKIPIDRNNAGDVVGTRVPMPHLTWWLSQVLSREERPVIDKTGLDKFYDFTLAFAPEMPPGVNPENLPSGLMDRPTIFVALKEQLGLKLEAQKGPVETYVIDHVERPRAN